MKKYNISTNLIQVIKTKQTNKNSPFVSAANKIIEGGIEYYDVIFLC